MSLASKRPSGLLGEVHRKLVRLRCSQTCIFVENYSSVCVPTPATYVCKVFHPCAEQAHRMGTAIHIHIPNAYSSENSSWLSTTLTKGKQMECMLFAFDVHTNRLNAALSITRCQCVNNRYVPIRITSPS